MTNEVALQFGSVFMIGLLGGASRMPDSGGGLSSTLSVGLSPHQLAEKFWFLNLLNLGRIYDDELL